MDPLNLTSSYSFRVVGIGASAGGLESLRAFFARIPESPGMAFVVVQHLSPEFESMMPELLARHARLKVHTVDSDTLLAPNKIYLISKAHNLELDRGYLRIADRAPKLNLPIDQFFHSLARDAGSQSVAIIMSGTGTDGSRGLVAVHEAGGVVLAESPQSAQFDGMPRAAITTGLVDATLGAEALGDSVMKLQRIHEEARELAESEAEEVVQSVLAEVVQSTGLDFSGYRRATLLRRIHKRMQLTGRATPGSYAALVADSPEEAQILAREFLICVTQFFRDPATWQMLRNHIAAVLRERDPNEGPFRAWSVGCATGEEAYSIAMTLSELQDEFPHVDFKIFGSDANQDALTRASRGLYNEKARMDILPKRLARFFDVKEGHIQVKDTLRQRIVFCAHDVLRDPPFIEMDLVICRNVLVYMRPETQQRLFETFQFALNRDGLLLLGPSEGLRRSSAAFKTLDQDHRIFRLIAPGRRTSARRLPRRRKPLERGEVPAPPPKTVRERDSEEFEALLLGRYAPELLLVTPGLDVVYMHGEVDRYLNFPSGRPELTLAGLLQDEAQVLIRHAIRKATEDAKPVLVSKVPFRRTRRDGDEVRVARVRVIPIWSDQKQRQLILIEIRPAEADDDEETLTPLDTDLVRALRAELREVESRLQYTSEQLGASNEELQASNEELLASNEELQSANEELQSVNEELYSVNTELETKVRELRLANADLDHLIAASAVGTLFLDKDLRLRRVTPVAEKLFGFTPEDLGRPVQRGDLGMLNYGTLSRDAGKVLRDGQHIERDARGEGGSSYLVRISPYTTGPEVQPEGVVVTAVDVTAAKARHRDLEIAIESLYAAQSHVVVLDMERRVLRANPALASWLGIEDETELVGMRLRDIGLPERLMEFLRASDASERARIELSTFDKDGRSVVLDVIATRVRDADGVAIARTLSFHDLTALRARERALENSNRELQRVNDYLDGFVYAAAHDLRAPIANLLSLLELYEDEKETAAKKDVIDHMGTAVGRLNATMNALVRILDVQRTDTPDLSDVDIIEIHDRVVSEHRSDLRRVGALLTADLQVSRMRYVESYMYSILYNLVGNAIKYRHPDRPPDIKVRTRAVDGVVELSVQDNGLGIDLEAHPPTKLFRPFTRVSHEVDGHGIGLHLVKRMAEKNGGTVDVESTPGEGTTFRVVLIPYSDPDHA